MAEKKEDCVFCKIVRKEVKTEVLKETENFIAFPDSNPIGKGHTLIIPKKHFTNLIDLPSDLAGEMLDLIKKIAVEKLSSGFKGFNIVSNNFPVAGQAVFHCHIHLIPRKKGDNVKFKTI